MSHREAVKHGNLKRSRRKKARLTNATGPAGRVGNSQNGLRGQEGSLLHPHKLAVAILYLPDPALLRYMEIIRLTYITRGCCKVLWAELASQDKFGLS